MSKEIISLRLEDGLKGYVYALVREKGLTVTDVLTKFIKIGIENKKELLEELEKKRIQAETILKLEERTFEIKLEMKKVYLYNNFGKISNQLRSDMVGKKERLQVMKLCLNRIKDVLGEDSWQYKKASKKVEDVEFEVKINDRNKKGKS